MAKLLLVLFLAGSILNISYSRFIPQSSDLGPLDAGYPTISEDGKVPELNPKDDSDSLTKGFNEPKKLVKRKALPSNDVYVVSAPARSIGPGATAEPEGQVAPGGPLPSNKTMAPGAAAGSDFQNSTITIGNITDTVSQVVKQLGDSNKLVLARFGRAALDVQEDPSDDDPDRTLSISDVLFRSALRLNV